MTTNPATGTIEGATTEVMVTKIRTTVELYHFGKEIFMQAINTNRSAPPGTYHLKSIASVVNGIVHVESFYVRNGYVSLITDLTAQIQVPELTATSVSDMITLVGIINGDADSVVVSNNVCYLKYRLW